jgi:predicted ATPase
MTAPTIDTLLGAIETANPLYHRLVLIVGLSGAGKTGLMHSLADHLGKDVINVNLALSARLLELTPRQRTTQVSELLDLIIEEHFEDSTDSPLLLDNLEVLFDNGLHVDPLRLLEKISRNHATVATWNGLYEHGKLKYAELGHPEYKVYDSVDAMIVLVTVPMESA